MSVVPMRLLTMAGPLERFDEVIRACVIDQDFHPENTLSLMQNLKGIRPFEYANPYTPLLRRGEEVARQVGIPLAYAPFTEEERLESLSDYFSTLAGRIGALTAQQEALEHRAAESRAVVTQLENLRGLSTDLDTLWHLHFTRFRYGYLPRETYDSFQAALNNEEDILFIPTNLAPHRVYGVYFTTATAHQRVDTLFNSLHFTRVHIDAQPHGTVDAAMAELEREAVAAEEAVRQAGTALEVLRSEERERLLAVCARLRYQSDCYDLRRFACRSQESFYLTGWVPAPQVEQFQRNMAQFHRLSCVIDVAEDVAHFKPPTLLSTPFLGRMFRPFLEMYGLPSYHEKDPSVFMALTYCLFFGIMFGDLGQGLCLALIGLVLSRWKKLWLGNIMTCCGLSGAVFGCVYGSVFGFEHILPGFKILEESTLLPGSSNVLLLLLLSIGLGILMLLLVMVVNILNGIRQKDYEKIFFGHNGAAGILFYGGIIVAALSTLLLGVNLFTPLYVLPVLVLPLLCMLFKHPLSRLLAGDPNWRRVNLGDLLGTGIFELFETLLSYLTNTLSFMRIGAYAITHVGLMLVVHLMAELAGGVGGVGGILILVLGNLFVMGFEGLLVGIQVLRLEFYELFGRFYDDGGLPFSPKKIDYSSQINS